MFIKKTSIGVSLSRLFTATVVMNILAVASITISSTTYASTDPDLSVHPNDCVAPFLSQAGPMRWHEHYLMNPASNGVTFVVCPINFNNDEMPNSTSSFSLTVRGARMDGASNTPATCFFTVYDSNDNTQQPPYITNGVTDRFTLPFTTANLPAPPDRRWRASRNVTYAQFSSVGSENTRMANVFCRLEPGYSISSITWVQ